VGAGCSKCTKKDKYNMGRDESSWNGLGAGARGGGKKGGGGRQGKDGTVLGVLGEQAKAKTHRKETEINMCREEKGE